MLPCLAAFVGCFGIALAGWPQFRGPNGDNTVRDAAIATSFPASGPKVLWSVDVSDGYGGAAISGDEVFFMDRVHQEKDVLVCANLADGKAKWKFEHEVPGRISHPGSRTVPTVREDVVYASGGFGHVYCVDRKSGEKRWVLDVVKELGGEVPRFGYAVHPLIYADLCIIAPIGDEAGMAAVNKKDGKTAWKSAPVGESHSSPVLVKLLGREMVVLPGARRGTLVLKGVDPKDGKELFEFTDEIGGGIFNAIPNLTVINTDTAMYTGGYGKGTRVLKFAEDDGKITVRKEEQIASGATIHPPLVVGEQIYLTAGRGGGGGGRFGRRSRGRGEGERGPGGRREGRPGDEERNRPGRPPGPGAPPPGGGDSQSGLVCLDPGGKVLWATGNSPGFGGGSIILAGGVIISQDGDDGTLRLIKPGPAYEELASGKVFSGDPGRELWAPMALSDGKLMMRSQNQMVCVDLSVAKDSTKPGE